MKTIQELRQAIEAEPARSAWSKGVKEYALELLEEMEDNRKRENLDEHVHPLEVKDELLNGAKDWNQYSWGGCSFIYDSDIAERLCTPSELKRNKGGENRPNSHEEWLDVQARALNQACRMIVRLAKMD